MNLTALQHSPFLQSLGWAIANSLWQAAALWIAYHLINGVYRNASAKFKNNLSTILISSAFVWFCITLFNKYFAIQNLPGNYEVQFYQAGSNAATTYNWNDLLNEIAWVLPYLSVAYLSLLIFLSIRLINIYRFTRFIKFNGLQKPGVEWKLFTEKVARHMGITKKIRLWVSHHIDVPATIGFIKPVILIPLASVNQLSAEQLEAIILHELSHIKRNDYLINLFISIIETILFFNPFVVLLARIIKRERENCCDDFVIQYQYDRHTYASALLSLEQFRNINLRLAIGATMGKKQLLFRIKRIMEINNNTNFNYGQKLAALFLITGIICSVAWLSPQNNSSKKQQVNKSYEKVLPVKIKGSEKADALIFGQGDNKVKSLPAKSQLKKALTEVQQLKELKDLNLKEIAAGEYKLVNRLLQESKKEIVRKSFPKFNSNKFLFPGGSINTPSLFFDNGATILTFNSPVTNVEFARKKGNVIDLQKLQAEFDKAQFSFSFDEEEMQNAMKNAFNSRQLKTSLLHLNQNLKAADIEKLINIYNQNFGEKILQRVQVNRLPKASAGANGRSIYIIDSAGADEIKIVAGRAKQIQERVDKITTTNEYKSAPALKTVSNAYAYGYSITTTDEKEPDKVSEKHWQRLNIPNGKGTYMQLTPGAIYRTIPNGNNNPVKTKPPKQAIPGKDIRVEYKNGVVVINGVRVELPDSSGMLAQFTFKGKKILSRAKDLMELHIND
ncbi:MAG: regulatory sensor-transducer, BlaR1/MecR1 family [Chitinophagaceae bacterium]|nr:regulatory sensor-transducer, BlaR1/MecR1 family [Chitinophagaceae bacterium]